MNPPPTPPPPPPVFPPSFCMPLLIRSQHCRFDLPLSSWDTLCACHPRFLSFAVNVVRPVLTVSRLISSDCVQPPFLHFNPSPLGTLKHTDDHATPSVPIKPPRFLEVLCLFVFSDLTVETSLTLPDSSRAQPEGLSFFSATCPFRFRFSGTSKIPVILNPLHLFNSSDSSFSFFVMSRSPGYLGTQTRIHACVRKQSPPFSSVRRDLLLLGEVSCNLPSSFGRVRFVVHFPLFPF